VYEPFLEAVSPQLAVVSVGRVNSYGHPSPVMVETYGRLGIPVLRTDRHGAVTVVGAPSGMQLACESSHRLQKIWQGRHSGAVDEVQNFKRLFRSNLACDVRP
jgi:beta-lactamase superfamily II metal-dependent hydrolase